MKRVFGLLIIAIVLPATTGNSQTAEQSRGLTVTTPEASAPVPYVQGIATAASPMAPVYWNQNEDHQAWNEAIKALRDADSESAKTDAKNKIEELLTAQYDESLDSYDKYLEELSEKIAEMKKQVEKRRAAKDEMVQLKLLMVVSEAEGLGWPDNRPGFGLPSLHIQGGPGFRGQGGLGGGLFHDVPPPGLFDGQVHDSPTPGVPPQPARPAGRGR